MDIFVVDKNFSKQVYVENVISLIWTERYNSFGDFELHLAPSEYRLWRGMTEGNYLSISPSNTLMIIETVLDATTPEGERTLKVSGRSLTAILQQRAITPRTGRANWITQGSVGNAIAYMVRYVMTDGGTFDPSRDVISGFRSANNTQDSEQVKISIPPKSLYDAVKDLAATKNFAFGVTKNLDDTPGFRFFVYEGQEQDVYFGSQLDNLAEESYLRSIQDYYNVAYVFSKDAKYRIAAYPKDNAVWSTGLPRRVITVNADDIDIDDEITTANIHDYLVQRGRETLLQHQRTKVFDGQLTGSDKYEFGRNYHLGDIVTLMGRDGFQKRSRIAEYIHSLDNQGYRGYPSFEEVED